MDTYHDAVMHLLKARIDELEAVARHAIAYDEAITACADDPGRMSTFCTAQGADLDSLYAAWITSARAAMAKALTDGEKS